MNSTRHQQEVETYYIDTGLDYGEWSREYNMHFGYYRFPMNPFCREPMLNEMNQQVFNHLKLLKDDVLIYDLGCGLAAPSRAFAKRFPDKKLKAVTIVQWQIEKAAELDRAAGVEDQIELVPGDYTHLPFENNSADGIYALESCCHCEGLDKAAFVDEMMRLLKPGKRFVIVDGFIKSEPSLFRGLLRYCYNQICKGWALPSFPHLGYLKDALKKAGANNIEVKDFSFRVAPSVMHAPFTVLFFLLKKMLKGEKLNPVRIGHLKSCLLGLVLGLHCHRFAYCLVTGIKNEDHSFQQPRILQEKGIINVIV